MIQVHVENEYFNAMCCLVYVPLFTMLVLASYRHSAEIDTIHGIPL